MAEELIQKLGQLVDQGTQLVPLGGFDFSGYNARLQNKYLEWRKTCLEMLERVGPIGVPYKSRIMADAHGGQFFQSSAQLILTNIKELFEKLKASPELAAEAGAALAPAAATVTSTTTTTGARVLRPPPKPAAAAGPAPEKPAEVALKKVYVIGEELDPLRQQLGQFLQEIGLEEIVIHREHGKMVDLEQVKENAEARYAFFVFNSDDLTYAMFEIGHFVGKLGKGRVCVLHMTDVEFPKNVPGILIKPLVVKLEEASLSLMKELKAAGYKMSL